MTLKQTLDEMDRCYKKIQEKETYCQYWIKKMEKLYWSCEEIKKYWSYDSCEFYLKDRFKRKNRKDSIMTIYFSSEIDVTITFDNYFDMKMIETFDEILNRIHWAFLEYGFDGAVVVSNETGEVIAEIDND